MKVLLLLCGIVLNALVTVINTEKEITEKQQHHRAKRTLIIVVLAGMIYSLLLKVDEKTLYTSIFIISIYIITVIRYLIGFVKRHQKRLVRYRAEEMIVQGAKVYLNGRCVDGTVVNLKDFEISIKENNIYLLSKSKR